MKLGTVTRNSLGLRASRSPEAPGSRPELTKPGVGVKLEAILVPIDFSESSRAALRYGAALAQRFGATLTLLNVVDLHPNNPADARLADDLEIQASGRLVHLLQQEVGSQVMADTLVREGRAWKAITDSARLRKVDLIVLGARGHTPHARGFLGRTAELVVRHAPCPVLVVGK